MHIHKAYDMMENAHIIHLCQSYIESLIVVLRCRLLISSFVQSNDAKVLDKLDVCTIKWLELL